MTKIQNPRLTEKARGRRTVFILSLATHMHYILLYMFLKVLEAYYASYELGLGGYGPVSLFVETVS